MNLHIQAILCTPSPDPELPLPSCSSVAYHGGMDVRHIPYCVMLCRAMSYAPRDDFSHQIRCRMGKDGPERMEALSKEERRERFRHYLRTRLQQTGVTKRELSLAMGKDRSYVTQLLDEEQTRPRALPDLGDLFRAAPLLGVPLVELLEQAYGITRGELELELAGVASRRDELASSCAELTVAQQEQVRTFIAYVKGQDAARQARPYTDHRFSEQAAANGTCENGPEASAGDPVGAQGT